MALEKQVVYKKFYSFAVEVRDISKIQKSMVRNLLLSIVGPGEEHRKKVSLPLGKNNYYLMGLGNCGEGAGNGSFERDSLSYSQRRSGLTCFS